MLDYFSNIVYLSMNCNFIWAILIRNKIMLCWLFSYWKSIWVFYSYKSSRLPTEKLKGRGILTVQRNLCFESIYRRGSTPLLSLLKKFNYTHKSNLNIFHKFCIIFILNFALIIVIYLLLSFKNNIFIIYKNIEFSLKTFL